MTDSNNFWGKSFGKMTRAFFVSCKKRTFEGKKHGSKYSKFDTIIVLLLIYKDLRGIDLIQ